MKVMALRKYQEYFNIIAESRFGLRSITIGSCEGREEEKISK